MCYPVPNECSYFLALYLTFLILHPHTYVRMSDNTQVTNIMGYVGKDGILKTPLSTVEGKGDKAINAELQQAQYHM